jgi:hypothetical protein
MRRLLRTQRKCLPSFKVNLQWNLSQRRKLKKAMVLKPILRSSQRTKVQDRQKKRECETLIDDEIDEMMVVEVMVIEVEDEELVVEVEEGFIMTEKTTKITSSLI